MREGGKKVDECRELGGSYLDLANLEARLQALLHGDIDDIDFIARQTEFCVKKKLPNEKCSSLFCVISSYDLRVNWIQCDVCNRWFHLLCEQL